MSVSSENFLKGIYQLTVDQNAKANASRLASRLSISHAAVTDMAKKLSIKGLVLYVKYKEIKLTSEGEKIALQVIRKHRLWETFLNKVLHLQAHELHNEAEILEHNTSDFLIEKIDAYLDRPAFDPHGDPIPDKNGQMPDHSQINLLLANCDTPYIIKRIQHIDKEIALFFESNKIFIDQEIRINSIFQRNQSIAVEIKDKSIVLDRNLASLIYVENK